MTEEIKEILEEIRIVIYYNEIQNIYKETQLDYDSSKKLLNYITNLQKENKDLKESNHNWQRKLSDYKQRNEKAVEFIKEWWYEKNTRDINRIVSLGDKRIDLYNILQGGDE